MSRVIVNLVIDVDLDRYADEYGLVGPRSARDDIKRLAMEVLRKEFARMGFDPESIQRR
ncbi:hypothetical protein SEA_FLAVERINT_86 [Mycobacterium phage Flaverint]|nr:hypothetical protein SEA_FLAVERINT_86 [Mycobacterium phage Flaverint]